MPSHTLNDAEVADLRHQLQELQVEHRDLDLVIAHLTDSPPSDDLLIRRLKKRKLALKDAIAKIEDQLIPNIIA